MAVHVAERLLQLGAIPLTFSDSSGHIYESDVSGVSSSKVIPVYRANECAPSIISLVNP